MCIFTARISNVAKGKKKHMKNSDESAFAFQATDPLGNVLSPCWGLSKREYFAGLAMQGLSAEPSTSSTASIAKWSVEMADALLAELEKPQS